VKIDRKPTIYKNKESTQTPNNKTLKNSKSVDFFQTTNQCFYSSNNNFNKPFLVTKKSQKKIFTKEKSMNSSDNIKSLNEEPKPGRFNRKMINDHKNKKCVTQLIISQSITKDNTMENYRSTSKKHYMQVKPTKETFQRNDKQNLLPVEYAERYNRPYSRSNSK
jgi:hypothetical protein